MKSNNHKELKHNKKKGGRNERKNNNFYYIYDLFFLTSKFIASYAFHVDLIKWLRFLCLPLFKNYFPCLCFYRFHYFVVNNFFMKLNVEIDKQPICVSIFGLIEWNYVD